MKKKYNVHKLMLILYVFMICCMILLLGYMGVNSGYSIFQKEKEYGYRKIENIQCSQRKDGSSPTGIKKEYVIDSLEIADEDDCLAFYLVHHYAQVYVGDELVYSLTADKDSVSKTVGCNWAMIPLSMGDDGKEIKIVVTPVYKSVSNRTVDFLVGSKYSIFSGQLKDDLSDIIISVLAIGFGIGFVAISLVSYFQKKSKNSLGYLGLFSLFIGIWKITDIRSAPLLFPGNPVLVSQISNAMLAVAVAPFVAFIHMQFEEKKYRFLDVFCIVSIFVTIGQILLQLTGKMDLRESISASHVMIAAAAVSVIFVVLAEWKEKGTNKKVRTTFVCFLLCVLGAVLDVILYYVNGTSYGIMSTIAIFLLYIVMMGTMAITELNQRASIDFGTGLFNRSRCSELLQDESIVREEVCLMMFDLNRLKIVNDTLGHDVGDVMISRFADMLRQNMPAKAFLGRYGGDEFIAVLKKCDQEKAEKILEAIEGAIKKYNLTKPKAKISCSAGYALSENHPGCTMLMLMQEADKNMYRHKRAYYENVSDKNISDENTF